MFQIPCRHSSWMTFKNLISCLLFPFPAAFVNAVEENSCLRKAGKEREDGSMHIHSRAWLSGSFLASGSAGGGIYLQHIFGFNFFPFLHLRKLTYLSSAATSDGRLWVAEFLLFPTLLNPAFQMLTAQGAWARWVMSWFCLFAFFRWHLVAFYGSWVDNCHSRWTMDCGGEITKKITN